MRPTLYWAKSSQSKPFKPVSYAHFISSILNNPTEPKYKTIKSDNATLKAKLFCITEMQEILIELGFYQVKVSKISQF